jgi:hypothetical protein
MFIRMHCGPDWTSIPVHLTDGSIADPANPLEGGITS